MASSSSTSSSTSRYKSPSTSSSSFSSPMSRIAPIPEDRTADVTSIDSVASRWVTPDKSSNASVGSTGSSSYISSNSNSNNNSGSLLWAGVCRDNVLLVESDADAKTYKAARRFLQKPIKADWDFHTYATQSQSRLVQAVKLHVYERLPIAAGERAKLRGLQHESFLNGVAVRVLDYYPETDKYLIRPTIPLSEKLSSTGQLIVKSKHLHDNVFFQQQQQLHNSPQQQQQQVPEETESDDGSTSTASTSNTGHHHHNVCNLRVWTIACLYDGKKMNKTEACQFIEKILVVSEAFRHTPEWIRGGELSCMESFAPLLQARMDLFQDPTEKQQKEGNKLEYCRFIIKKNRILLGEPTDKNNNNENQNNNNDKKKRQNNNTYA